ncbi:hypothetical protein OIE52_50485 [Streptomyces canus]|uniref:hypothetical protein n=1 Tax=Streptomyces canus TaxID=58343 RepID=UPI00324CE826
MMLPFDTTAAATLRYSFDLEGREPADASKVLRLHQRLLLGGDLRLTINGQHGGSGRLPATGTPEDLRQVERLLLYLADLDAVQRHCEAYFPAPLTYTAQERIDVRVARLLIEGRCVAYPYARTLTLTLNGQDDPTVRRLLSDGPQGLRISPPGFEITIGGRSLDIGAVTPLPHLPDHRKRPRGIRRAAQRPRRGQEDLAPSGPRRALPDLPRRRQRRRPTAASHAPGLGRPH